MIEEEIYKDCYYKETPDNDISKYISYGLNIEGKKKYLLSPRNDKYLHSLKLKTDLEELMKKSNEHQKERQKKYEPFDRFDEERLIKIYSTKKSTETEDNKYRTNVFKSQQFINDSNTRNKLNKQILTKDNSVDIEKDNKENELLKSPKNENNIVNITNNYRYKKKSFKDNISYKTPFKLKHNLKSLKCFNQKPTIMLPIINPRKIIINTQLFNDSGIEDKDKNIGSCSQCMGVRYNPYNYDIKPKNRVKRNIFGGLYLH